MTFQTDLYDSLKADIINLTNRPDLEVEIELALKTATVSAHLSDFYPRDQVQTTVPLPDSPVYQAQLDIPTFFPMFRAVSTVQLLDINNEVVLSKAADIPVLELDDIYNLDNRVRASCAYVAGSSLNIRYTNGMYGVLVSWFQSPNTTRDTYDSWIAQAVPAVIVFWAAAIVFNTNGNEEKANKYMKMVDNDPRGGGTMGLIQQLRNNYLTGAAR